MARSQSIGEAILRELGGVAQNVGGQVQATQDFNQALARKTGIEQRDFDALQLQRSIQNKLAQDRELRAQQQFDITNPMGPPAPEQKTFKNFNEFIGDMLGRGEIDEAIDLMGRKATAERAPTKPKGAPTPTPLQLGGVMDKLIGKRQKDVISQANAYDLSRGGEGIKSIGGLEEIAGMGPWFEPGIPVADERALDLYREYKQYDKPSRRQSIVDSIQSGQLRPELFGGQQTGTLQGPGVGLPVAPQQQITDTTTDTITGPGGRITPEIEQWGQSEFHNWNQLTPEQKFLIAKQNRKL